MGNKFLKCRSKQKRLKLVFKITKCRNSTVGRLFHGAGAAKVKDLPPAVLRGH